MQLQFSVLLATTTSVVRGVLNPNSFLLYDDGLQFTAARDLHSLSAREFTVLQHPHFPAYSVRVKQSHFCDGEVNSYTGYVDTGTRHLFFSFFESRRDPDADDVVFWTNGGPGGSSSLGLFMELGPCRVTSPNTTKRFEQAWNENANVFFIDQPVGVGFSYADYGKQVSSTLEAAEDVAAFVAIFFEHFTKFKGRRFHMAGESYGGRYLPVFASTVYERNAELVAAGFTPINLTSVMIGNGCTDFIDMVMSFYDVRCMDYGFPKFTSISECVSMKQRIPRYRKMIQESCKDSYDSIACDDTWWAVWAVFGASLFSSVNAYDATRPCPGHVDLTECYPIAQDITEYLNLPETQSQLGIDPGHGNWTSIHTDTHLRFVATGDYHSFRAEHYLGALLERGVPVLIYVGANDYVCNWVGNERMTLALEFTAQDAFRGAPLREWTVDGEVAGKTRNGGGLTFATIFGAGHLAPYDQPARLLEMANRWLAGEDL